MQKIKMKHKKRQKNKKKVQRRKKDTSNKILDCTGPPKLESNFNPIL
jgi:hypothetical protein